MQPPRDPLYPDIRDDVQRLDKRIEDMAERVNGQMREMAGNIEQIKVQIAQSMSRSETESAISQRVHVDTYQSDRSALNDRIGKLENGPQRMLGWISLAVSSGFGCLTIIIAIASIIVGIILSQPR